MDKAASAGQHPVVCCDVADLGQVKTQWGEKHKVRIYWMLNVKMDDGRPFICAKQYTASLHEMAVLRQDLEAWRGRPFTEEELAGFDLENLIEAPALVNIVHAHKDQKTYANINAIMRLPAGMQAPTIDPEYKRWQDRQEQQAAPVQSNPAPAEPPQERWDDPGAGDDDIPF